MSYTHLSQDERYQIQWLLGQGHTCSAIARHVGRHASTIRREVQRQRDPQQGYRAWQAHAQARLNRQRCQSLTLDNGKEFAQHAFVERCLDAKVYFADPHSPWQRGTNENHNGLLRQYLAKGSDLGKISQLEVDEAVYRLNHRPRKCLGWKTPHEVFYGLAMTPLTLGVPRTL